MKNALVVLFASSVALADIAPEPLAAAADASPMDESKAGSVEMKSETVQVALHDEFAVIDATFVMHNAGAATSLEVGFPGKGTPAGGRRYAAYNPLYGFTAWVNGKPVKSEAKEKVKSFQKGPPGRQWTVNRTEIWHSFEVPFAANADTVVRVRYGVAADYFLGDSYSTGDTFPDSHVFYVLSTGAKWKGKIGSATVNVMPQGGIKLDSVRVRDEKMASIARVNAGAKIEPVVPKYSKTSEGAVVIARENFEPTADDDLEIVYRPAGGAPRTFDHAHELTPEVEKRIEQAVAAAK